MAAKEEGHPVCVVMVDGSKAMSEGPVEAPGFNEQGFPVNRKKYENGKEYLKEALEHTVGLIDPSIADGLPLRLVITKRDLIEEAHPNRNDFNRITRSMGSRATCLVDDIIAKNAEEEEVDGGFEFDFMARFSSTAAEYYEAELPAKILIDYLENQR
ncbi:MAG: hypothetical protein J5674_04605, partial [Candidatus Methanomethylophilaceae archaeon]|nr:hypothetical protein [Candidatus Methanomethylophilaceae archaeon]